jgi:hypothetical protein
MRGNLELKAIGEKGRGILEEKNVKFELFQLESVVNDFKENTLKKDFFVNLETEKIKEGIEVWREVYFTVLEEKGENGNTKDFDLVINLLNEMNSTLGDFLIQNEAIQELGLLPVVLIGAVILVKKQINKK